MREWDNSAPPRDMRLPSDEERAFIENVALRIKFERVVAESLPSEDATRHQNIVRGLTAALTGFLAARSLWVVPFWLSDDQSVLTTPEFETLFDEDSIDGADLEAMSDEDFASFLEELEADFPSDMPRRTPKAAVDQALSIAKLPKMKRRSRRSGC
ncbi:MAG: hypothetical protein HXY24_15360 [Rubrivivax sp.]|nr:hypothetical protein [Rubrivivax sp.]